MVLWEMKLIPEISFVNVFVFYMFIGISSVFWLQYIKKHPKDSSLYSIAN